MSPTAPSCTLVASIIENVERGVRNVPGVRDVQVHLDAVTFWTPEMMTTTGRDRLDAVRSRSLRRAPVQPRQWERQASAAT